MSRSAVAGIARGRPAATPGRSLAVLQRGLYHLLSFEAVFALFFYSNQLKLLFPPFPVDETIVLLGLSLVAGGTVILREGIYLRGVPILTAFLIFVSWAAISWGWSPSRRAAGDIVTLLLTLSSWALISGALIMAPSRERVRRFLAFVLLFSLVIAVAGLVIYVRDGSFRFGGDFEGQGRVYLSWGFAAASGAVIAFAWAIFSRMFGLQQLLAVVAFMLCAGFLLVNSGRGPLLSAAAGCAVALLVGLPRFSRGRVEIPRWQVAAMVAIAAIVAYGTYLIMSGAHVDTFARFQKLFNQMENPEIVQGRDRFAYFAAAIKFWLQAPILGNGLASFARLYGGRDGAEGTYPHNLILELLTELGLVGLVLYGLVLWAGLRCLRLRPGALDGLQLCVLMLLASRLTTAMTSYNLPEQWPILIWCGLLAIRPLASAMPAAAPAAAVRRPAYRAARSLR
jgi:O-antigen ligase